MSATTLGTLEHVKPGDIETRSFEIIAEELRQRGIDLDPATDRKSTRLNSSH